MTTQFIYGRTIQSVPANYIAIDDNPGIEAYGTVTYAYELTAEMLDTYALRNLNKLSEVGYTIEDAIKTIPLVRSFVKRHNVQTLLLFAEIQLGNYGSRMFGVNCSLQRLTDSQWIEVVFSAKPILSDKNLKDQVEQALSNSIELRHYSDLSKKAVIVQSENQTHKIVYFDKDVPKEHMGGNLLALIRKAECDGYNKLAPGSLDELSRSLFLTAA